ncbi:hypothetical protein AM507_02660 [Gardnerella vaginalis]|nr:hypothetical protein AM507_02660 [Gardnerella vaginalis]
MRNLLQIRMLIILRIRLIILLINRSRWLRIMLKNEIWISLQKKLRKNSILRKSHMIIMIIVTIKKIIHLPLQMV